MIERYLNKNITLLDVTHPTTEEIRDIFVEFSLPLKFASELTSTTQQSKVLLAKNAIKLTLDFPVVKRTDMDRPHEVKLIATPNCLIIIRFEDINAVHSFKQKFEVVNILEGKKEKLTGIHYFFLFLDTLYTDINTKLDYLESKINLVEETLFDQDDKETLFEISNISRRLISFSHVMAAHEIVLRDINLEVEKMLGKKWLQDVTGLLELYRYVSARVKTLSSTIEDLRNTNNTLLNTKQNEVIKTLTIMAFVTFPLSLFSSMFGMNTAHTPILGLPGDFWIIIGIMTFIALCFFVYFRHKKWL